MDALSKIFDDIHLNQSHYIHIHAAGDWALTCPAHTAMIAYIVLQGEAELELKHQSIQLNSGDLVLIPASHAHKIQKNHSNVMTSNIYIEDYFQLDRSKGIHINEALDTKNRHLILSIQAKVDMQMAKPLLQALPDFLHIQHIMSNTAPEWLQIGLQFLAQETRSVRPGQAKILDHLVSILFIECVRDYILNLKDSSNWLNALTHPELSNALSAIHAHPERPWTVESLAERCWMSRSKFAQLFTQIVGEPPLSYLQQHRLRLAAQQLRDRQYSIQSIAHLVGYNSETAFSQAFKRQYQQSPSQYRHEFSTANSDF